jgi:nicotinamide mononucleotide (NMN) deamidase PncC
MAPYPWHSGETLASDDLNAAIAAAYTGIAGPPGPVGSSFLAGSGPPTEDAPPGSIYLDVTNGDIYEAAA